MLDSKKLEDYLRLASHYGYFSIVPKGASNIRVSNIQKMSGGVTNETCSFLLTFTEKGFVRRFDLVMKAYSENFGLWSKVHHADEDARPYVREFQVLRSLGRVGFPVPDVYLCECDSFFFGYPFLIMRNEKVIRESMVKLDCFAAALAHLHNLNVDNLGIKSLRFPKDGSEFATKRLICLKQFVKETRHYRFLKKDFDYAISWLESNIAYNNCSEYCLIHGEYHPGHALLTNINGLIVIDWESVAIGDPAFDVGYAYHMVKLMYKNKNCKIGEETAEIFLSEYNKQFHGDVHQRLEFYKVVAL
jgi:aminoglycoside phosphotransferase (APT) family kinase protein